MAPAARGGGEPIKAPGPDDPMALHGVGLPAGPEAVREMAWVFAEEYARLGLDTPRILRLFRSPFYAGAHQAYRELGEAAIAAIAADCVRVWGRARRRGPAPLAGGEGA